MSLLRNVGTIGGLTMVSRLFGGRVSPLVAQLASQDQLSADDIAELEEILKGLKS